MTTQAQVEPGARPMSLGLIARTWWPLAVSWLCMAAELPALTAIVARLPDQEVQLAAYGGIIFPLALIIESPVIMLLAASTALCQDWESYAKLRKFMLWTGAILTGLHALVAFTPLYDFVVTGILGVKPEIVEPGRLGLAIMLPWTWSIAYRRFHQGVLIRFGHSKAVGLGTFIRILTVVTVLWLGFRLGRLPGVVVATLGVISGVLVEALYVRWAVQPVLKGDLRQAPAIDTPLTRFAFLAFYFPLVLVSLLDLLALPLVSAALSRMPRSLPSLAVWPVVDGLLFILQSAGVAFNEVVVALLGRPGARPQLKRFTWVLLVATTGLTAAFTATPLAALWFGRVIALKPDLAALALAAMWFGLPLAGFKVLQSWFGGQLMVARRTRGISEAVGLNLVVMLGVLVFGIQAHRFVGLYVGMAAVTLGMLAQTLWLWGRSRGSG